MLYYILKILKEKYAKILITLIIAFISALIFGNYLYKIVSCKKTIFDFIFNPIDNLIYKICAIDRKNMTWQKYSLHLIAFNALVAIFSFVIFYLQDKLFFKSQFDKFYERGFEFKYCN